MLRGSREARFSLKSWQGFMSSKEHIEKTSHLTSTLDSMVQQLQVRHFIARLFCSQDPLPGDQIYCLC